MAYLLVWKEGEGKEGKEGRVKLALPSPYKLLDGGEEGKLEEEWKLDRQNHT